MLLPPRSRLRDLGVGGALQGGREGGVRLKLGLAAADATPHAVVLTVCLAMLAGAIALAAVVQVDDHLRVGEVRLPGLCTFRNVTGLPCAGCGLTRSWVSLAQGDLVGSVGHHRLGWLLMLYVALQAARHGVWLTVARWRSAVEAPGRWLDMGLVGVVVLLLVDWAVALAQIAASR